MSVTRDDDKYLDIEDRFDRLPSLRWSEFERFLKSGVPARALVYPELPARARVTLFPDRPLFDFANDVGEDGGVPAFVFLARDEFGDACDLVAWAPGEARVAAWLGRASMLGLESFGRRVSCTKARSPSARRRSNGCEPKGAPSSSWIRRARAGAFSERT